MGLADFSGSGTGKDIDGCVLIVGLLLDYYKREIVCPKVGNIGVVIGGIIWYTVAYCMHYFDAAQ